MYSLSHCLDIIPSVAEERLKDTLVNQSVPRLFPNGGGGLIAGGVSKPSILAVKVEFTKGAAIMKLRSCKEISARVGPVVSEYTFIRSDLTPSMFFNRSLIPCAASL